MVKPASSPRNAFVRYARMVYNPLGFAKGYNFILWVIFDGAFLGFILARFQYLNFAAPGECYWYRSLRLNNVGIIIHLSTILPAALLAVFQFVPAIRHNANFYHRIAGYIIILLVLPSQVSAIMIANHAFGGDSATRGLVGVLVLLTTVSLTLAVYNIKRLQIDQHRAWMLLSWAYFASIITLRLIMFTSAAISETWSAATQPIAMSCEQIINIYGGATKPVYTLYPACLVNSTESITNGFVAVQPHFGSKDTAQIAASLDTYFGMSGWIALFLHAVFVEVYLKMTPRETARLRQISYEKQLKKGLKYAGSSGLVVEKYGDAEDWIPQGDESNKGQA